MNGKRVHGSVVFTSAKTISGRIWSTVEQWAAESGIALGEVRSLGRRSAERAASRPPADSMGDLRSRVAPMRIDANWVENAGREKKVLVSDMDSTIIPVECFDEVAARAGVGDAVRQLTARAMAGKLSFPEAYRARLGLCAGVSLDVLEWVWRERISLNPGAGTLVRTMSARGASTVLVTGGFQFFAERVGAIAGFSAVHANGIAIRDGRMTGEARGPILDGLAKRTALKHACAERGVSPRLAVAIGDGANDALMVGKAGIGVAWRAKPALAAVADAILDHSDLDAVLSLQGILESEFVADPA